MTSNGTTPRRTLRVPALARRSAPILVFALAPLVAAACSTGDNSTPEVAATTTQALTGADCGFAVSTIVRKTSKKGFHALVKITRAGGGQLATPGLSVLVNAGAATLDKVAHGTFQAVENGYLLNTVSVGEADDVLDGEAADPDVLGGRAYRFLLKFEGPYTQLVAHVISSSGVSCDQTAPTLTLGTSGDFFTSGGSLTLTAHATDDVAVSKVVFARDGVEIGTDQTAPYSLTVPVTSALNGRHRYTATAFDLTGNQGAETKRVLVAIDNQFFGTATANAADYPNLLAHFNQLTPGNAGKWGSLEAARDQMNFAELDIAYAFAKTNGIPFKFHTLVWGQQQPAWIAELPAAEQLEELEEFMAAIAARYPDIELIDVVNEPLHAPPSYAGALGGDGTTGWDWVVKAFEMARTYFPNTELLLNDYAILTMASTTQSYVDLVKVLKDRGLIDGIGEQGHFYERAPELSVLSANLATLAGTGLPLYISELDLNFANDTQQANRMRDVFTLFSSAPSVVGITHWGHEQGNTWQPNAYLIRSDGTLRPALTWIECFRAGGTDCTVPPYVSAPRTGEPGGITLEAEEYDSAQGLLPAGNVVAYASNGSWFSFDKVVFDTNWNSLDVTYANGGASAVDLTIHLDSLASAPVATIALAPTGGWGTMKTVSVPWTSLGVQKDVFAKFNGGGANVDRLKFAAPASTGKNIVANGTFESGASGWYTWGGATLSASTDRAHGGTSSLLVADRTTNSPAAIDLTSAVKAGTSYPFSLWASLRSADGTSKAINVTQATSCRAADGTISTSYAWIAGPTTLDGGASWSWVQFAGTLTVPNCTLTQLQLFIENGAGSDLFVDDVQILDMSGNSNLIPDGTFETGNGAWGGWGFSSLSAVSTSAHSGTQSLRGAAMQNGAVTRDIKAFVAPSKRYQATAWVSVGNLAAGSGSVRLQTIQRCNGAAGDSYPWLQGDTVSNGAWKQLTGVVDLSACTSVDNLVLFVGADSGDVYLDDVTLTPLP